MNQPRLVLTPDQAQELSRLMQEKFKWSEGPQQFQLDGVRCQIEGIHTIIQAPTGSGKTSVLMALLREMHYVPLGLDSWVNLPRNGGVAYAAQESWVINDTIRGNILFGAPYDEERYKKGVIW